MEQHHSHPYSCTHCACNNPILKILKEDIFHQKNYEALPKAEKKEEIQQELIIRGGIIRPMINGAVAKVDAIGIASGQVKVTGTVEEVNDYMTQHYPGFNQKILNDGQTLLPGLIEPHVHIVPTALMASWIDLSPFKGQDLIDQYGQDYIKLEVNKPINKPAESGDWYLGFGLDPALMAFDADGKALVTITNEWLDQVNDQYPLMVLSASMHTLYLNTLAMNAVYAENEARLQPIYGDAAGYISQTQGQLQEAEGMGPALKTIPKNQLADMLKQSFKHFSELFRHANERGITMLYDAGMNSHLKLLLNAYLLTHRRKVRVGAAFICDDSNIGDLQPYQQPQEYKDIYYGHVKVVSDGSNQGLTGYQSDPYICVSDVDYGIYNYPDDDYVDNGTFLSDKQPPVNAPNAYQKLITTVIDTNEWPLMVHANGNQAVDYAIQTFQAIPVDKIKGKRHRIEHCSLITDDQLDVMQQLEVSPSFLIGHVGYWGYAFQQVIFGDQKTQLLDRCKSALNRGMRITLHSDNQVSPLGPLRMMEQSITRKMEKDPNHEVLNSKECIGAEQALVAITYDAAWQCYADKWLGSLEADKFADFVILAQDPLSVTDPFMKLRNIPVLETWVGGRAVYQNLDQKQA
ncbi:amidohydrolase [Sphingobacterium kitahiroshimense]|uniref:Amidohydrolase family protein n=1 Tax=Sphingobacterium kitahiroshimense TaxID=470446 RepID=A0ABV0BZ01_9SPHI